MRLPDARVGPYVRALAAALHALAPNADHPPLDQARAHLGALDPTLSGELLAPAEVDPRTGMPAFPWMERVRAEQDVALERPVLRDDQDLERAAALDPDLATRLRWRRDLHLHLRTHAVLPTSRAEARARRLQKTTEVLVAFDRMNPDGTWTRIGLVLAAPAGARDLGCARVAAGGRIDLDPGLLHLLSRHASTPLVALRAQVQAVTEGTVRRLSRGTVGPFWFPGVQLPGGIPADLGRGLVLHLALQVVADDVRVGVRRDPLEVEDALAPPAGHAVVHDRRFACTRGMVDSLVRWARERGSDPEIVVFS